MMIINTIKKQKDFLFNKSKRQAQTITGALITMAKTIRTKVFLFNELNEKAQQKAIEQMSEINFSGNDWYNFVYEDASNIGLKITSFDIDRGDYCEGEFINDAESCANEIIKEHGEICETYKTAQTFLEEIKMITNTTPIVFNEGTPDKYEDYSERENLIEEASEKFLKSICKDYKIMLQKDYEYLYSEEAIKETIEANEYYFTQDGKLFNK